jgi:hypothetical protein
VFFSHEFKGFKPYFCTTKIMNFELTEEHLAVQQAARDFAQTELLPGVIERDEHQKFPAEQIKFDKQDNIMAFKFQELNKSNFIEEI